MASKLDKLNLSTDELDRFKKAMEDPTFRNLLQEYTDEISNPANRAETEAYLREVEQRAAGDTAAQGGDYSSVAGSINIPKGSRLISPNPVFCLKAIVSPLAPRKDKAKQPAKTDAPRKVFINLCTCEALDDVSTKKVDDVSGGKGKKGKVDLKTAPQAGSQFSLPYSLSAPRDTPDAQGASASVFDFVFSQSTWEQYASNMRVVTMFQDMALEAVEEALGLVKDSIDKRDTTVLKNTTFKGGKPPPKLWKMSEDKLKAEEQKLSKPKEESKSNDTPVAEKKPVAAAAKAPAKSAATAAAPAPKADARLTPKHSVLHRGYFDFSAGQLVLSNEQRSLSAELAKDRPKELVVRIELPGVAKVGEVDLDQSAGQIVLSSAKYLLVLALPFPVDVDAGSAKWNAKKAELTVTLVVAPPSKEEVEKYAAQRKGFDQRNADRDAKEKADAEDDARKEAEAASAAVAQKAQDEREAHESAEAARRKANDHADEGRRISPPAATERLSPSGPIGVLKTSPNASPRLAGQPERRVRFSFSEPQAESGIPERDGPLGPKPVHKLLPDMPVVVEQKKGHKKKHKPGAEGPEAWTGVGVEPTKELQAHLPPEVVSSPTPTPVSASASAKKPSQQQHRLWPAYTYNQSSISVTLIVKVKSIVPDSVRLLFDDAPSQSGSVCTKVDLYFSAQNKNYRLFLPLAYQANHAKSNFACTGANLILNLIKLPLSPSVAAVAAEDGVTPASGALANEWDHLLDYSVLGVPDSTPLSSPAVSPSPDLPQQQGGMSELTLGDAHSMDTSGSALVHEVDAGASDDSAAAKPAAAVPLQPLPIIGASSMMHSFVGASTITSSASASAALPPPSAALLFQLD